MSRLALLTVPLAALAGCAHVTETRTQTVVATRPLVVYQHREPERDRTDVTLEVEGDDVRARVERTRACARGVANELTVRERVVRTPDPRRLRTDGVLAVTGLAILAATGVVAASCTSHNVETGRDEPCLGIFLLPALAAGAGLGLVGGVSAMVDASKGGEVTSVRRSVTPVVRVAREPCARDAAEGSIVTLELPSGHRLDGRIGAAGVAVIPVPPALWVVSDGALDVDVRVDGVLVRRATLRRSPP